MPRNPFANGRMPASGPSNDLIPVTPSNTVDLVNIAVALYITVGGDVTFVTEAGNTRTVNVPSNFILPVGVARVNATGTTATGIHAFMVN